MWSRIGCFCDGSRSHKFYIPCLELSKINECFAAMCRLDSYIRQRENLRITTLWYIIACGSRNG